MENHTDMASIAVDEVVEPAISGAALDIVCHVYRVMLKSDLRKTTIDTINERIEHAIKAARTKAALEAELAMAKRLSAIRVAMVKNLENHIELRARQFEDFSALLEQNCFDYGEDSLGAGGPQTTNLNIAHEIQDVGDQFLEQTVNYLEAKLPGETVIAKIEAELVKANAKEEDDKKEGGANDAH